MTGPEEHTAGTVDEKSLRYALERLALGFESEDPHIRHESKMVAKTSIEQIAHEVQNE
jgi:hypothetical protein